MTVTYTGEVPNGSTFGCFYKILCKWRGSVYKLIWRELLAYLFLYYTINIVYRFFLNEYQQTVFSKIRTYFDKNSSLIPITWMLGFYVTLVVNRWWQQYKLLPWPDTLALFLNAGIPGGVRNKDDRQRLMRRTVVRYAVLAYVITLQRVSLRVKKRFPTWQHVVDCGLMMDCEKKIFELMDAKTPMSKYWMPLVWATNIINRARKESLISSDHIVQTLLTELSDIRRRLGALIGYDTVCVPLVYTQVVTLAFYSYFVVALLGAQSGQNLEPDLYFPFLTVVQFCFYLGWLKVAEVLINPFGEDDDDIELNWLIDRHIKAAYMIVDEMHEEHPELLKDQYWEEVVPKELPYTVASEHYRREEPKGSAEHYKVKASEAVYANLVTPRKVLVDDMYADYESVDTPIVERRKSMNWFTRQISRMGSVRSASTAYSSGGLFSRHRGNSVYVSPENGQIQNPPQHQKMSIYERFVRRRSGRNEKIKQGSGKLGSAPIPVKNRPRIPTPDVTKEFMERERMTPMSSIQSQITLLPHQLQSGYPGYPGGDLPLVQVVLSPIQELDGTSSVNNTLHAGQPGTAALAQAVLSPGLGPVLTTTPMTVSQLTSIVTNSPLLSKQHSPIFTRAFQQQQQQTQGTSSAVLTEVAADDSNNSVASDSSAKASLDSNTTASLTSKKSAPDLTEFTADIGVNKAERMNSSPASFVSVDVPRSRKTSATSQGAPKRGEVYV